MGRYVHGTQNFNYKYVFAAQPTNLNQLAAWAGFGQQDEAFSLSAQLYLPHDEAHEQTMSFITGVAPLTSVYEAKLPPSTFAPLGIELSDDLESSIEALCRRWSEVIWVIDAALPGPPLRPDLCTAGRFSFERADWPRLAARIGHGADCEALESLKQAQQAVWKSGEDDYLPLLAVNALIHAVTHQCERFELVDADAAGEGTNLWEVAADYAFYEDDALKQTWEYRAATARRQAYCRRYSLARAGFEALLKERPDARSTAEALFAVYIWEQDWRALWAQADALLGQSLAESTRATMLRWRGEAWLVLGERVKATEDAHAAAELGRGELLGAIERDEA